MYQLICNHQGSEYCITEYYNSQAALFNATQQLLANGEDPENIEINILPVLRTV